MDVEEWLSLEVDEKASPSLRPDEAAVLLSPLAGFATTSAATELAFLRCREVSTVNEMPGTTPLEASACSELEASVPASPLRASSATRWGAPTSASASASTNTDVASASCMLAAAAATALAYADFVGDASASRNLGVRTAVGLPTSKMEPCDASSDRPMALRSLPCESLVVARAVDRAKPNDEKVEPTLRGDAAGAPSSMGSGLATETSLRWSCTSPSWLVVGSLPV